MINQAKSEYYENQISQCKDQKAIFKVVDSLLHHKGNVKLPSHACQKELAHRFNDFFIAKISKIRKDLDEIVPPSSCEFYLTSEIASPMEFFAPATEDKIYNLVLSSPLKSCTLDPIPTWMLKQHINIFVPVITKIVNMSLEYTIFSSHLSFDQNTFLGCE